MVSKARQLLLFSLSFSVTSCLLFVALALLSPNHSVAFAKTPDAKKAIADIGIPVLVKDIVTGSTVINSDPANFVVAGGDLYFAAHDDTRGDELWLTDGSPAGTHIVKDMIPGAASSNPGPLVDVSGTVFF